MEEKARAILAAIKRDNLTAFKKLLDKETEKYSFGRFPLLSLCYLYSSRKIAFVYERRLLKLSQYTVIEEDRESYRLFRQRARRALRLYVGGRTVSPLVMLAVTGRHDALRALYPAAYNDAAIRSELTYVEQTLFNSPVSFGQNGVLIHKQKYSHAQLATVGCAAVLAIVMIACCLVGYFVMPTDRGTPDAPMTISNGNQLSLALKREGYFRLTGDVDGLSNQYDSDFKGTLNGAENTLKLSGGLFSELSGTVEKVHTVFTSSEESLFCEVNTGTIKDVVIDVDIGNKSIEETVALLVGENKGRIENVTVNVKGNFSVEDTAAEEDDATISLSCFCGVNSGTIENVTVNVIGDFFVNDKVKKTEEQDTTAYLSCFCNVNNGKITDCKATCRVTAENGSTRNAYLSPLVSQNNGSVSQCSSEGTISTETVDIGGLVSKNESAGTMTGCSSTLTMKQETTKNGWSSNIGGLCLHNNGTITGGVYTGTAEVTSRQTKPEDADGSEYNECVYLSGIACQNGGTLSECVFRGELRSTAGYVTFFIGGVAVENYGSVTDCVAGGKISASGESAALRVGGLVALNYYKEINGTYYVGGVSGGTTSVNMTLTSGGSAESHVGGAIGTCSGAFISGTSSTAKITCLADNSIVGGIVGAGFNYNNSIMSLYGASCGIYSCESKTEIKTGSGTYVGGIAGYNAFPMSGCVADVKLELGDRVVAGGIAGANAYQMSNVEAKSIITAGNESKIGGVNGINNASLQEYASETSVVALDDSIIGGAVATNASTVRNGTADIKLTAGKNAIVGGIAATNSYYVTYSRAVCDITAGDDSIIGGAVGKSATSNNYSTPTVGADVVSGQISAGNNSTVGGVIGKEENGLVQYMFTSVQITSGENSTVGGLVGMAEKGNVEFTYTYKEKYAETYKAELEKLTNPEVYIERAYKQNAYYLNNGFVGTGNAIGVINEYEGDEGAYLLETTAFATEREMKQSDIYKEIFGDETEQDNNSVSGDNGTGSAV